jgi:hypothetical protein
MVEDMNSLAESRLEEDYNIFGYPTIYFDGGKEVLLGGGHGDEAVGSLIESCATSDVHDLDLNISVTWQGDGELKIDYTITNLEEVIPPQYIINKIIGGLKKVNVFVENIGENNSYDIDWQITISGGIFGRVDSSDNGTIYEFPAGETKLIRTTGQVLQPFGFGKITIVVKIGDVVENFNGFIIGNLILVEKIDNSQLEVQRIRGGIKKVKVIVKNVGDSIYYNVPWEIFITGGLINRIRSRTRGRILMIPADRARAIDSDDRWLQPRGVGNINIQIKLGSSTYDYDGFILGKLLIVNK